MVTTRECGFRKSRREMAAAALLLASLAWTAPLRAQGVRYDNIVLGPRGVPAAAATIAVCTSVADTTTAPCSPLATIYSDEALMHPVANPFPADSLGNYGFWASPAHYIVQIYGSGLTTKVMDVFLPCDPANCTASSASFSTLSVGTLNLTGALTVNGRTVATEAASGDAVYFVSPNGNDSNDGLSWGSAFQTFYHAVTVMEGSSVQGGTLYAAANSACGGPVTGQGLWLFTTGSSPGSGWLQLNYPLRVVGVGTTSWVGQSVPSAVNLNCGSSTQVALQLSSTDRPIEFDNLGFTGSEGLSISASVSAVFRNDYFNVNRSVNTNGPAVLISSTSAAPSFNLWFYDCLFNANAPVASPASDASEAFVVNPGGANPSDGLIFLQHVQLETGDLKYYMGGNFGSLFVDGLVTENQTDGHGGIWFVGGTNAITANFNATLENIAVADATGCVAGAANNCYAIENDGSVGTDEIVAWDLGGGNSVATYGPMTVLGATNTGIAASLTALPLVQGQPGPYAGRSFWQSDSARRTFGPSVGQFANLDPQLPTSSNWNLGGGVTVASATAPDGTNNAGLVSNSNSSISGANFHASNVTLAAGDYLIGGVWAKGDVNNGGAQVINVGSCGSGTLTQIATSLGGFPTKGASSQEWEWYSAAYKVSGTGGSCPVNHSYGVNNNSSATFYAPVLYHVSSGAITDSEAALIALHLAPYPDTLTPPVEATLRGHPFAFGGSGDNFFATLDHAALTANQVYNLPNASGTIALVGANGVSAGTITITSSTSGSHTFTASYASPPVCTASPSGSTPPATALSYAVGSTTGSVTVTLSATASAAFNWQCQPAAN
ncbi:MAG TPA: hypothetical protein VGS20_05230 [Candidatus Acidoferrales bacterium]|nr:hypothetical protein [Candidatus Acidoferrales bacterium]